MHTDDFVLFLLVQYFIALSVKKMTTLPVKLSHCFNYPFVSSVRSSNSHPDLLVIQQHHPLFQIPPGLNTGLSLSEPLQLYKGYNAI